MIISTLEKMELIVENNPNLQWNGWNVEYLEKDDSAMYKIEGAFVNGDWHIKKTFNLDNGVWDIPSSILRKGDV
jgi:hypothetical protein